MKSLLSSGERVAGRYPWLFTFVYILAIAMMAHVLGLLFERQISVSTIMSIAALHMAVEARYGSR